MGDEYGLGARLRWWVAATLLNAAEALTRLADRAAELGETEG